MEANNNLDPVPPDILFIQPPYFRETRGLNSVVPSLGLSYLTSALSQSGFSSKILDLEASRIQFYQGIGKCSRQRAFLRTVARSYPRSHLIGIGPVLTLYFRQVQSIATLLKQHFPDCKIIMGGPHFPRSPAEGYPCTLLEQCPEIDFILSGYGELSLPLMLQHFYQNRPLNEVPGLHFRESTQWNCGPPPNPLPSLDLLPSPSRSWYLESPKTEHSYFMVPKRSLGARSVPMLASRGCPYGCVFCSSARTTRSIRSPQPIVAEMEMLYRTYGISRFIFFDDLFVGRTRAEKERMVEFCQRLQEKALPFSWEIDLRADVAHYLGVDVLRQMIHAGLKIVNLGLESPDSETLEAFDKHLKQDDILKAIQTLRDSGEITICGTFILGGEQQTPQEIYQLIDFAIRLGLDYASFNPLVIHTNRLFQQTSPQNQYRLGSRIGVRSPHLSVRQIQYYLRLAYQRFYFRSDRIRHKLKRIKNLRDALAFVREYVYYFRHAYL